MMACDQKFGMKLIARTWRLLWFINEKNVDFRPTNSRNWSTNRTVQSFHACRLNKLWLQKTLWFKYRCGISVVWRSWLYWVKSESLGTHFHKNLKKKIFPIHATTVTGRQIATPLQNSDTSEFFILLTWFVTSENPAKNIQRVSRCLKKSPAILLPNWTLWPGTNYDVIK